MISKTLLKKYDKSSMYKTYDQWPKLASDAYMLEYKQMDLPDVDHIIFAGMGGSGSIGDVLSEIFSQTSIHITNVKGYLLPKTVNKKTLIIVISVSGNTDEAIEFLKSASSIPCNIASFSSGGMLENFCHTHNIAHYSIPFIHSPRASFINYIFSILKILKPFLPINDEQIFDAINQLQSLCPKINSDNLDSDNPSLDLANWISGIPAIYYPHGLKSAAIRFKNSLNENSKVHAIYDDIIEASHNGIVPWENRSNVNPILIEGTDDYVKTKERWKVIEEYFSSSNINFKKISTIPGNILAKLVCLIYLLDYATIYLAVKNKIDPTPVLPIDFIKSKL